MLPWEITGKRRIGSVILGICLVVNVVEPSPVFLRLNSPNPKTCCGRPVCLCTHPKGSPCPFKNKNKKSNLKAESFRVHGFCHLKNKPKFEGLLQDNSYVDRLEQEATTGRFLKQAPCHSDGPKSSLPAHAKEFYVNSPSGIGIPEKSDFFFLSSPPPRALLFDHRLKKPPKNLLSAFVFSF